MNFETIITNGLVVDGTGNAARRADVGIVGDRIAAVEPSITQTAPRMIDATDCVVTPGFIDVHTHLDAQIWWDPAGTPSTWHGYTSVVVGNCGVTFAPCRPDDREYLATMMESVEDIPAEVILGSLPWTWETYGQFLDTLDQRPLGVNVGGMIGHCALRYYAMGDDSMEATAPSPEQQTTMNTMLTEALNAGALGVSTSRTAMHTVPGGRCVPGTYAPITELQSLVSTMRDAGGGVLAGVTQLPEEDGSTINETLDEIASLSQLALDHGVPFTFNLTQGAVDGLERRVLDLAADYNKRGARVRPQTTCRPIGVLYGFVHRTPFDRARPWKALRSMPLDKKLDALRDRETRQELIESAEATPPVMSASEIFVMPLDQPRYDLTSEASLQAHADRRNVSAAEAFIDLSLDSDGQQLFSWSIFNGNHDAVRSMVTDPTAMIGLGDAGAHVAQIMDASQSTHLLAYWVRDQGALSLSEAVYRLTADPADLFGLNNRGRLTAGSYADVNVIAMDELRLHQPEFVHDFPLGAGRFIQRADGFRWTLVNGIPVQAESVPTGAMPGGVLRS